ncbi:MAG: HipA family kinase [Flavobacteriales bacterium]
MVLHEAKSRTVGGIAVQSNTQKSKIWNKQTLLRIALFDIWTSNEDRNHNNYNLLMTMASGAYDWVVIDHGEAFNSNNAMQHGLTTLTYHDSILQSELYHLIFQKPHNFAAEIELILTQFDQWITKASHETVGWIDAAPDSWGANKDEWKTFLMDEWLSLSWSNDVKQAFREHCQSMIS